MKFNEMFGAASFVSPDEICDTPYIRGEFSLPDSVESAEITICGLGFFELSLNGRRVGDDLFVPVTSDYHFYKEQYCYKNFGEQLSHRIYCLKYDVAEYLVEKNCIGVLLAPGWYKNNQRAPYGEVKLCFNLKVTLKNGETKEILSGNWLEWTKSPIVWYGFYNGEAQNYDKIRLDGWDTVGFSGGEWSHVTIADTPETEYYIQDCPADKVIRYLKPKFIRETENGFIYDCGENISGTPILCSKNGSGEKITLKCGERLNEDGTLDEKMTHWQNSEFITDGSNRTYSLRMMWYGFRYFEISKNAEPVSCAVIHADTSVTSDFSCDNPLLNWLYKTYIRTQLNNMHCGIPSDCPHIEKRGYTGDGQLLCECGMMVLDSKRFYRKWIDDIFDCQDTKSGHVQYTAPYFHSGGGPGGWGSAIIEVPYTFYKIYGDSEPLRLAFAKTLKYFDYLDNHSEYDLVTSDQEGDWFLGDWCAPGKTLIPEPFVNTYFYIKSIDRILEACDIFGEVKLKEQIKDKRKIKVSAILKNYFDEKTGDFAGNIQAANAFAIDIGLGDERTLKNLVSHYEDIKAYDTGIFGTDILTKILFEKGYSNLAFDLLTGDGKYSFRTWMNEGCTTLPENWNFERSLDHPMFGAVTKYLFTYLLGIRCLSPGYNKILIKPCFVDGVRNAKGYITTNSGKVFVGFKRTGNSVAVTAEVPDGVVASIDINGEVRELSSGKNELFF